MSFGPPSKERIITFLVPICFHCAAVGMYILFLFPCVCVFSQRFESIWEMFFGGENYLSYLYLFRISVRRLQEFVNGSEKNVFLT